MNSVALYLAATYGLGGRQWLGGLLDRSCDNDGVVYCGNGIGGPSVRQREIGLPVQKRGYV